MKNSILNLCVFHLMFFTLLSTSGFAELGPNPDSTVYLTDADPGFSCLLNLNNEGFFRDKKISAQYLGNDVGSLTWSSKINLISDSGFKDDNEYAAFTVSTYDFYLRRMKVEWMAPKNDTSMQGESIETVLQFVQASRLVDPHEVLRRYALSPDVVDYSITFTDSEKESIITGYSLKLAPPLSSTHRFVRTVIGLVAILGVGEGIYWYNAEANKADWEYEATWHDYRGRFGDAWTLDTNSFNMNTVNHTYSGATYYMFARSNDYDVMASTLFTFAGSLVWEYVGEFREKISINDMVFTTLGGSILGEGLHNLSIYVENKMPRHFITKLICFVIDPMREINRYLDYLFMEEGFTIKVMFMNPGQALYENTMNKKMGN